MFIETYIALAMLAILVPIAIWMQAQRGYNESIDAQIEEDTCDKHGVFLCEECFDFTIVS